MAHEEKLRALLDQIAKEKNYNNHKISLKPISSGGANYTSHLYLATLSAPGKDDLHMFAKKAAIGEEMRASLPKSAFTIEPLFYTDLIKVYRQVEEKYNVKDEDKLVTATFYGASAEYLHEMLVLENLTERGFRSFDRFQTIDWPYASFAIKQLALFHALSVAFAKEDPEGYEDFFKTKVTPFLNEAYSDLMQIDVDKTIGIIKEENKEIVAKFLENPDKRKPMLKLLNAKGPMIIHGDYRPSNMMHRKLSEDTTEVVVLDFQTYRKGNPVIDLLYLLFLSTDKKFRNQYLRKSFEHYYHELSAALRRYGLVPHEVYSKDTFEKDVKENMPYMLSCSFFLLLVITKDEHDQVGENLDVLKTNLIANEMYVERVNDWVDDCIAMGLL